MKENNTHFPSVRIFHASFNAEMEETIAKDYLNLLNPVLREEIRQYKHWEDRQCTLLGKLMLQRALKSVGLHPGDLSQVLKTEFGRPYIEGDVDFNISHSGNKVICAVSTDTKLGVDIEQIRPVDFNDYKDTMTKKQWQQIQASEKPYDEFFKLWAMKESAIKADGRGLSIPLTALETDDRTIQMKDYSWHITPISLYKDYASCICTGHPNPYLEFVEVQF